MLPQPVTGPSPSLLGHPQLPDGVQVPHHNPRRVDDHSEVGFILEATDDVTRVDVLGLQGEDSTNTTLRMAARTPPHPAEDVNARTVTCVEPPVCPTGSGSVNPQSSPLWQSQAVPKHRRG